MINLLCGKHLGEPFIFGWQAPPMLRVRRGAACPYYEKAQPAAGELKTPSLACVTSSSPESAKLMQVWQPPVHETSKRQISAVVKCFLLTPLDAVIFFLPH